jgi:nitrate reductase delta subunit
VRPARARRPEPGGAAVVHQAAALLLGYPDPTLLGRLPLLRAALEAAGSPPAALLLPLVDHLAAAPPADLAAAYVRTFDFTSRHCLHLTWWTDGDTRRRGAALVRFKERYRAHGLEADARELPDFLPVVLEFSAATRTDALLREYRPALELLRLALAENGTPYACVPAAVCATLPGASPADRAQAMAMARGGPPREDVGLTPYGHLGLLPVLPAR